MPIPVSRRDFLRIATGSIITLPGVAAATIASVPQQALAAPDQESTTDDVLYTNEIQLVPLTLSEVAFVVCDVSIGDNSKNRVAGAHVRIISTATGKAVEGTTAEDGSVMFDIKDLAICGKDESRDDLKKYTFIGMVEITCEGYRDFLTGQFYVEGMQTHVIPTRKLEKGWPYPARVSFDGWDVLYTDNTPTFGPENKDLHILAVTIKNVTDDDEFTLSLLEKDSGKVVCTMDDFPMDGEFSGGFTYHFLQEGNPEALAVETDYCMRLSQGDKTWEFPIRLKPKSPVFNKPETLKPLQPLKPVGNPTGGKVSASLPRLIPIGGGGSLSSWIPNFGPVQVALDPCGSATIAITIGQLEYPWGKSSEWSIPPNEREATRTYKIDEGSMSATATGNNIDFKENQGWKWFPQKTLAKQWEDQKKKISQGVTNFQAARAAKAEDPSQRTISFSKVIKVNFKVQLFGVLTWDILDKDTGEISFNRNPGFSGVAGVAAILSADFTYSNNFLAGPVPVLFQFGFKANASLKATAGLSVKDTDSKRQERIKQGLPVKSWSEIMGDWDYWNWDFANTGFSLTLTFSPWISLGVGVKGVASVSVRGSITFTYYIGASFPTSALGPDRSNPHMIWGISAGIDLVFELFFFTHNISVVDLSNKNFYNSWNNPQWQPEKWEVGKFKLWEKKQSGAKAQSEDETFLQAMADDEGVDLWGEVTDAFNDEQMDEMLQNMSPITDAMMLETVEAEQKSGLVGQSEEGDAPRQVVAVSYNENAAVTEDGFVIPAIVYTFETAQEYEKRLASKATDDKGQNESSMAAQSEDPMVPEQNTTTTVSQPEDPMTASDEDVKAVQTKVALAGTPAQDVMSAQVQTDEQPTEHTPIDDAELTVEEDAAAANTNPSPGRIEEPAEGQMGEESAEGHMGEEPAGEAKKTLEAQADDGSASPFSYACPEYERYWESPIGGLLAMADDEPVAGIGDEGGVILSDAYDARLNPSDTPVFGSQRMQVVSLGSNSVLSLRIGVVSVNGQPRTRVIVTKIAGDHDVGLMRTLDFKIIQPQIDDLAYRSLETEIEGYKRENLYDYEFSAAIVGTPYGMTYLQIAVLSGKRDLSSGGSNAEKLAQSATDLVLTWVYADVSPLAGNTAVWSGKAPITVKRNFSWPGSLIFGDDDKFHSISNLQLNHDWSRNDDPYVTIDLETTLITFLDRSANTAIDTLSHKDGAANVRLGMLFVAHYDAGHYQTERYYALAYRPDSIEQLIGAITDGSTHELRFWSRSDDHYTFMVRGASESRYYVLQVEPGSSLCGKKGDQIVAKIKNIRLVAKEDGTMRLHHWRSEDGTERFLATKAGVSAQAEDEDDGSIDRELCQVTINEPEGTAPTLNFEGIGPHDFSLSSFGAYGDFIYWPGTKDGYAEMAPTQAESEADVELVSKEPVNRSWLMGSRLRHNKFSEPFYLADLKHDIDHVVSVSGTSEALDVVCCGLTNRETGQADVFRVRVPFVRCVTATHAMVESPYVVHGRPANFFITVRNDGNTFIGGCQVEMWHEDAVVARTGLTFSKDTLQESSYNPAIPNSDELEDVEPDYALAPGKTSVYRVTFTIPDTWVGGVDESGKRIVKKVKFRTLSPTTNISTDGAVAAQAEGAEEEGIEYSAPTPQASMDAIPIELYKYDDMSHTDAPMTLMGNGSAADGNTQGNGSAQASTKERLPNTSDNGGLGVGGALAAAAGAAMLAYERRRNDA